MRIAVVSYQLLPQTGTSARTIGFIQALVNGGHQVVIVGANAGDPREEQTARSTGAQFVGVTRASCVGFVATSLHALHLIGTLREINKNLRIDIVHFFSPLSTPVNPLVYPLIRRLIGAPVVSDIQYLGSSRAWEPNFHRPLVHWLYFSLIEKLALRSSDAITAPTFELKEFLASKSKHPERFFSIPNCINAPQESCNNKERGIASRRTSDNRTIFFHGNFTNPKPVREVMRLFAIVGRIRELGHNVVLQVAGLATERIPPTRVPFQKLGYVQNPMTYLMLCDLVILPVKDRTLGMHSKLVEAMAAGKPVLATREACCGLLPLVGRSGIIICDTISEMVAAACKCFDDPELMDSMGMKNRDLAAQLFSIAAIGAQLESTYARTLQLQRSLPQNKNGGNSGRD